MVRILGITREHVSVATEEDFHRKLELLLILLAFLALVGAQLLHVNLDAHFVRLESGPTSEVQHSVKIACLGSGRVL